MADEMTTKRKFLDKIRDTYRVTVLDEETLEEVGSYNLSLLSFYIIISVVLMLVSALVGFLYRIYTGKEIDSGIW
ncbi:MAG: hypothetical protein LC127_06495 [Chitinophagales bacterium]|nr:hypothetical protein [Chitinophagales bacterium]